MNSVYLEVFYPQVLTCAFNQFNMALLNTFVKKKLSDPKLLNSGSHKTPQTQGVDKGWGLVIENR